MLTGLIVRILAAGLLSIANVISSPPQQRSPYGVAVKAGPAFSWLKRLDSDELASVNERCPPGLRGGSSTLTIGPVSRGNTSAAHLDTPERIIGGQLAAKGQFPYAAALGRTNGYFATCGATLISPRHLLTAAHCVLTDMSSPENAFRTNQTVWLGGVCSYAKPEDSCPAPDMLEVEMELAVKVYYSHSARDKRWWRDRTRNDPADLALMQLREPIDHRAIESGRVTYACLPPPPPSPLPQSLCSIGWGRHSDAAEGDHYSARLRFVHLLTRPREEWSVKLRYLDLCPMSRALPRFCQFPPERLKASIYSGDSGSAALAVRDDDDSETDVIYGVVTSTSRLFYSLNDSDPREPYVWRLVGNDVSVQFHLDELCYHLGLGCDNAGVSGVGTTLPLSSFYLKRPRSDMAAIAPFALVRDEESILNDRSVADSRIRALVGMGSGRRPFCVALVISPHHLVTTRRCLANRYVRAWNGRGNGGESGSTPPPLRITINCTGAHENNCTRGVEFIAWQRITAVAAQRKQAGSDLAIVQLASATN